MELRATQPDRAGIVIWELTRACKLSCLHCPIGAQQRRSPLELSTYEAYKTIDQIAAVQPEEMIITGGDPLERADILQLIDYARRRGLAPSMMVSPTPALNGASIGKLRRNGLARMLVSIDSAVPERHDAGRGLSGQFASTLLAMRWARTAELPLEVNTLITRRNVEDLERIGHLLTDVGVQRWNVYFLVPIGDAKQIEMLTAEEVESVFERLQEISAHVPFAVRTFEAPQYRRFVLQKAMGAKQRSIDALLEPTSAEDFAITEVANARATTDRSGIVFISHTGEVSISPFLPITAGNVRYQPLGSLYRGAELFAALRNETNLKGKCGICEFRKICGGSRARAFAMAGDVFAADPLCSYQPGAFISAAPTMTRGST